MTPADRIPQLDAMRAGVSHSFPITLGQFTLHSRPLTVMENLRVTQEVVADLQKVPAELRTSLLETNLLAKKMLVAASTSAPGKNDPKITDYILDRMTPDELQHMYMLWVDGCKKCSPAIEELSDAELLEMAELVKKNEETLTQLSRSRLSALVRFLLKLNG